ncbi:MAG: pseudouridine-5'-phosphate glycosidase [Bacilli bacterium]
MISFNPLLDIKDDVKRAILANQPVVALESTIISHGMPFPQNVKMAKTVEQIVRDNGAIPATIAIMDGKIKIGLSEDELLRLGTTKEVVKVSRRDLASTIAFKKIGATTVASTMICAQMANIKFFVTGGIGGVHRGYEETLDVSSDLEELANTNVTVICAGAKAILDLPRTLEYLETKGVGVIGYQTKVLPAFYTRSSAIPLQLTASTPEEIALVVATKETLGLQGGLLIVNPIPEIDSLDEQYINNIINIAIEESKAQKIEGKDVTPFLLKIIVEKTSGKSLQANLALVYNNAKLGAQIATAYFQKK